MGELLGKAWRGWLEFEGANKLTALFLLSLFLFWILKPGERDHRRLFRYGSAMGIVCICPITAAVLLLYQTKYYDYQWIWTLVPFTAMIACGGVLLLDRLWKENAIAGWQKGIFLAGVLALVLLCGGGNGSKWDVRDLREEREKAARTLEAISEGQEAICLWAPEEILEHARSLDGSLTLVYGRNMWQEHLNAFSYDVYTPEQRNLYAWMSLAEETGRLDVEVEGVELAGETLPEGTVLKGEDAVRDALSLGVNRILLPDCMEDDAIEELERILQCNAEKVEEYYLFRLDPAVSQSR